MPYGTYENFSLILYNIIFFIFCEKNTLFAYFGFLCYTCIEGLQANLPGDVKEGIIMSLEGAKIILERQQTDIEFKTQEDDEKDKEERAKILKEFGFGIVDGLKPDYLKKC